MTFERRKDSSGILPYPILFLVLERLTGTLQNGYIQVKVLDKFTVFKGPLRYCTSIGDGER